MKDNRMIHGKNYIRLVNICLGALLIAGCGGGNNTAPNPVIRSFQTTPSIISKGQPVTLFYSYTGLRATLSDGVTTTRLLFGNFTTFKPSASTTYTLTVTNIKGVTVSASTLVTLSPILGRYSSTAGKTIDPRDNHTATLLPGGKVLLAGGGLGITGSNHYRKSAELFDPATGISTRTTGFMAYSSALHTATLLKTGMVLVAGGWDSTRSRKDAQLYNPATGLFTPTALYNPATGLFTPATGAMSAPRCGHTATLLGNGKVLITGGYDGAASLANADLYDPATGAFTPTNPMHVARFAHTATLLNTGKVLITGGNPSDTRCELYDPATGTFTLTGSMNVARSHHAATLLSGGTKAGVLIAGGATGANAELYDPVTGTFSFTDSMTVLRTYLTATLLEDTRVLLAGGSGDNTAEFYDPDTRTFAGPPRLFAPGAVKPLPLLLMNEVRTSHTATLIPKGTQLSDGSVLAHDMVFIAGGTGAINKAEIFR
jgi:galactose oxidase-like protein